MRKCAWILPGAAVFLALGVCFLSIVRARDDDDEKVKIAAAKKAAPDVQKLIDAVAAGKNDAVKQQVDALTKKYDELAPIMWQMKPVDKGGMQIGKPGTFPNDSIELGLLQLGKKPPAGKALADQADVLQKMAQVTRAIAEVAPKYASKFAKTKADEKAWNDLCADMAKASDDLISATQKGDDKAFKKAINDANHSCNDCHTKFRDSDVLYDVEQAARAVKNPAELKTKAAALVSNYPLDKLSWTFRPREKGGLGVGPSPYDDNAPVFIPSPIGTKAVPALGPGEAPKPVAAVPNGIEAELGALEHAPPTAAQLAARAKDLQHLAEVVRVIAEATPGYAKKYASNDDDRKKWGGFSDDMKQGSDDLIAAVQAKDVQALQKALGSLNQSCKDCHAKFR